MKKRMDVLLVAFGMAVLAAALMVTKVHADLHPCTAVCPSGWTQSGGSCPGLIQNCPHKCTGFITCAMVVGTTTLHQNINCACGS